MIAFLGTGLLGANFTRALLKKGEQVNVWNRTAEKAKALETYGAKAFEKVEDAVKDVTRIHLTLSDDAAVDDVLSKAVVGFSRGAIVIDHTTTSAPGAAKRSQSWAQKGFPYLHAPVFMGPPNALESTGTMLVSGDQTLVKKLEPELEKMTGRLVNLGDKPERAAAIKLMGNLLHIGLTGTISDLLTLADSFQVQQTEVNMLLEILNPAVVAAGRVRKITSKTFDQPSWELSMARKDARLMVEQAQSTGAKLMVIPAVAKKMDDWLAKGKASNDWTIISQPIN